jgi:hypothetical protein
VLAGEGNVLPQDIVEAMLEFLAVYNEWHVHTGHYPKVYEDHTIMYIIRCDTRGPISKEWYAILAKNSNGWLYSSEVRTTPGGTLETFPSIMFSSGFREKRTQLEPPPQDCERTPLRDGIVFGTWTVSVSGGVPAVVTVRNDSRDTYTLTELPDCDHGFVLTKFSKVNKR